MNLIKTFKMLEEKVDMKREYNTTTYVNGWEFDMHDDKPCLVCYYEICYDEDVPSDQEMMFTLLEEIPTKEELKNLENSGYHFIIDETMKEKM